MIFTTPLKRTGVWVKSQQGMVLPNRTKLDGHSQKKMWPLKPEKIESERTGSGPEEILEAGGWGHNTE